MISHIRRVWSDAFLRGSAIFFIGSMAVAFVNYLLYPLLGRVLSVEDYGEMQAIVSLATVLAMAFSAFTLAAVHASVNCKEDGECAAVNRILRRSALAVALVCFFAILIVSRWLTSALHFSSIYPLLELALLFVITALFMVRLGHLQGQMRFVEVSIGNGLVAVGRLVCAVIFVLLGWRVAGAIGGIVAGQAIGYAYVYHRTREALRVSSDCPVYAVTRNRVWKELGYAALVFVANAGVTVLYTADVLVIRRFFPADLAGYYSGIAAVAKIIFFATVPIAGVLMSAVRMNADRATRLRVLKKSFVLVLAVGGGATLCFWVAPSFFVQLLMGTRYLEYAQLLPSLGLAFFLTACVNVLVTYALALRRYSALLVLGVGMIALSVFVALSHETPMQVVHAFIVASAISLVIGFGAVLWAEHRAVAGARA